jgi:outer membrane protein OmpA-like peptidoglycan-associated protein
MNHVTRIRLKRGMGIVLPLVLVVFFLAGCGPSQKEIMAKDQVERAKQAFAQAKANPNVEAYAPMQLQEAGNAVQAAEKAAKEEQTDEMLQLGYLAERKTQYAVTVADGKVAERDIDKLNVEKAEVIARKQTLEAGIAKSEAEKASRQAEQARAAAAVEATRAAKAKQEAEQAQMAARAEAEKAARAKAEADQLMKELANLKAQQTERGIVLTIGDVLFATGKADLSPDANRSVDTLADFLKKYPSRSVLIEGFTDSVGKDDYNLALSRKRADSVKAQLVGDGIEAGRITTVGYGKKYPVASNDTKAGKAQNRRVEVVILNEGVQAETQIRQ